MRHIEEDLLDRYALGSLSAESIIPLEEHLLVCAFCQSRLAEADRFLMLFRDAATSEGVSPAPRWMNILAFQKVFWPGAAAALTVLLIFLSSGDSHHVRLPPAILMMHSLRGPDAGAEMSTARPFLLVFDAAVSAARTDYEIAIVDAQGNKVLNRGAEVRDGRLAVLIEKKELAPGSYWVRVYRKRAGGELLAEYSLRAE